MLDVMSYEIARAVMTEREREGARMRLLRTLRPNARRAA